MQTRQTELEPEQAVWEAVLERACGLDVHQKTVPACLLIGPLEEQPREFLRTFHTTPQRTSGNEGLASTEWLYSRSHRKHRHLLEADISHPGGRGNHPSDQCPPHEASTREENRSQRRSVDRSPFTLGAAKTEDCPPYIYVIRRWVFLV